MSEEDKFNIILGMLKQQTGMIEDNRKASDENFKKMVDKMPFDHLAQHDLLRTHLAMSPDPKIHGDHHDFTDTLQKHMATIVSTFIKGIGVVLTAIFLLGIGVWVMERSSAVSQIVHKAEKTGTPR